MVRYQLLTLYKGLSKHKQVQLFLLVGLMVIGMGFEILSIALIIPFITLISDVSALNDYQFISRVLGFIQAKSGLDIVLIITLIFVSFSIFNGLVRVALLRANLRYIYSVGADIGLKVFENIINQPLTFHTQNNSSISLGATRKVDYVVDTIIKPLLQGVVSFLFALGIILLMVTVAPEATAVFALIAISYYGLVTLMFKASLNDMSKTIAGNETSRINAVQESLGSVRDVIVDKKQDFFIARFGQENSELRRLQAKTTFLTLSPRFILESLGVSAIAIAGYVSLSGGSAIVDALPVLGLIAISAQKLLPLLQQVYASWSSINGSSHLLSDVVDFLNLGDNKPSDRSFPDDGSIASRSSVIDCSKLNAPLISVADLSFRYNGSDKEILHNISFVIERGESIGIIGETGSGKSTLMDLIMGLVFPTSGHISVNGLLLDQLSCLDWFDNIAHVPQSIYLLDASISENIALGEDEHNIDVGRLLEAARRAKLDTVIDGLEDGFDTRVGERGVKLSGGQRQRIGIARALYKGAAILVFDEATSALDSDTERLLIQDIISLKRDITTIMIAHRLTTLSSCDRIIKLNAGQISWMGSYDDLDV